MLGNHKGSLYIGSIFVGDLYRLRYSLSWWLGFPTRHLTGEGTSPLRLDTHFT